MLSPGTRMGLGQLRFSSVVHPISVTSTVTQKVRYRPAGAEQEDQEKEQALN
jgi:hypothetical protein